MPDATRKTLSATETPALFGASAYLTRWMLFQKFAKGLDLDGDPDARMNWGKKLQPLIIAQAAEDLKLEVRPNAEDTYHRRGLLGCTRDATIVCPDRGPGALETKCVFDFGVWMRDWDGGKRPPRSHEIQLQQQMYVGDGTEPYRWGVIAAWLAGEVHYFEREPIPDLWHELETEAARFFDDVANGREPNAFGDPVEWPLMAKLFATESGRVLDLQNDPEGIKLAGDVIALASSSEMRLFYEKNERNLKSKILAALNGADKALLAAGVTVDVKRTSRKAHSVAASTSVSVKPYVPEGLSEATGAPQREPMLTDLAGG